MDYKPRNEYSAKFNPEHCAESLHTKDRAAYHYQCPRKPKPGTRYCWQHGPEGEAQGAVRRGARWKAKEEKREAQRAAAKERDRKAHIRQATNAELVSEVQRRGGWKLVALTVVKEEDDVPFG